MILEEIKRHFSNRGIILEHARKPAFPKRDFVTLFLKKFFNLLFEVYKLHEFHINKFNDSSHPTPLPTDRKSVV